MSGIVGTSHSKSKIIGRSLDTAKAWANFDYNTSGVFQGSSDYNVSSIGYNGEGNYDINFLKPIPLRYCVVGSAIGDVNYYTNVMTNASANTTTQCQVLVRHNDSNENKESNSCSVLVFGE